MKLFEKLQKVFAVLVTLVLLFSTVSQNAVVFALDLDEETAFDQAIIEQSESSEVDLAASEFAAMETKGSENQSSTDLVVTENHPVKPEAFPDIEDESEKKADMTENGDRTEVSENADSSSPLALQKAADRAPKAPQEVETTITDFRIEQPQGTEPEAINKNHSFFIAMDWKVQDENAILHEGDYFDITLPDNLRFPPSYAQPDFELTDDNGEVIAHAHVTPGEPDSAGGTVRVSFNDKINNKYNVHGTIYLGALFNKTQIVDNEVNTFEVSVGGVPATTTVIVSTVGLPPDHVLSKWGERVIENELPIDKVKWYVIINYRKSDMKNCVITDNLTGDAEYIQDSFVLNEVEYNDQGDVVQTIASVDISGKLSFEDDNKSFTLNLGDAGTKQYKLTYETSYKPGEPLKNHLSLTFDGENEIVSYEYKEQNAGGTAGGDLANKIRIVKVDADDNVIPLAGAVFVVSAPDGSTFDLGPTGADGTVTSGILTQGTYKVKEKIAPAGYELSGEEFTLQVTATDGAIQTITNKRIETSVSVTKIWVGPQGAPVTIRLLADGEDIGKTLTLSEDNGWAASFEGLKKYTADGGEIVYTVVEEPLTNYQTEISGDAANGFTVTNTITGKVSIGVTKKWIGPAAEKVTVELLADGMKIAEAELNEAAGWQHIFPGLDKYKNGAEIVYTVREIGIDGYTGTISGSMADGFVITNTKTPPPNHPPHYVPPVPTRPVQPTTPPSVQWSAPPRVLLPRTGESGMPVISGALCMMLAAVLLVLRMKQK